jgi:ABC-type transport system involved in cytochrome c biogenesis permease subunit
MSVPLQNVTHACFGLSYLLALLFELARLKWPRPAFRYAGLVFGAAGLVAHSAFLVVHHPTPADPYGALLAVAWVLAVFYLYGTLHHPKQAWAVFVLPVVLALVGLALAVEPGTPADAPTWLAGDHLWGAVHGVLLLLAAVGVSVGFLASVMYLVQAARLRAKVNPLSRFKLLSLERLEEMNRRAVNWAFPLLTLGLLLGAVLLKQYHEPLDNWLSVKVVGTVGLWLVFLVLVYLRYATHVPGRRLALLTMVAFGLMLVVLVSAHPFALASGGGQSPPESPDPNAQEGRGRGFVPPVSTPAVPRGADASRSLQTGGDR